MSDTLNSLFANNRDWADRMSKERPGFFQKLAQQQSPKYLWIGCSDSRVPANEIVGLDPGEVFVHRNVANVVVPSDLNALSVIQFAVEHLRVEHIMVVGHYGCGGVKAAMSQNSFGIINKWLRNIKDVYRIHREEFYSIAEESKRVDRLIELNVMEQVMNLAKTSIIQEAWKDRQGPHLHGWVYGLADGIIKPIMEMEPGSRIDPIYEFDNL